MKEYMQGYYCRDDLHLQILNKESNRKILEALRDAYPSGLDAIELAEKTGLPLKTIYAQRAELYREYYIDDLDKMATGSSTRGRRALKETISERSGKKVVIEERNGIHDPYDGKKPIALPPGNVLYKDDFIDDLHEILREDEDELCVRLLHFLGKTLTRMSEYDVKNIKRWAPEKKLSYCCSKCGINHEARDFMRAVLLHLIDELEKHDKFIDFMKDNQFVTQEAYELVKAKLRTKKK